eukprot:CAMPEP_0204825630 /NCGR_PEP_ID=MMETSP1346-20131115/3486_1 /ASSEMBLY_ACC=CAM_ASM_000771 /TAXON_ID=215587 /ORGANISM="Aplanochytrium stocchinoi, Strain GSBS06" /LENGTH=74 /DNA_ID=CAMNT_0051953333 /DNA_START=120 /DNA_END=341 /DNA_ORIENTATION=+
MVPERAIFNVGDLRSFINSTTCTDLLEFIRNIGKAVQGKEVKNIVVGDESKALDATYGVVALLDTLEVSTDKYP